jgi:hypothetical protein
MILYYNIIYYNNYCYWPFACAQTSSDFELGLGRERATRANELKLYAVRTRYIVCILSLLEQLGTATAIVAIALTQAQRPAEDQYRLGLRVRGIYKNPSRLQAARTGR